MSRDKGIGLQHFRSVRLWLSVILLSALVALVASSVLSAKSSELHSSKTSDNIGRGQAVIVPSRDFNARKAATLRSVEAHYSQQEKDGRSAVKPKATFAFDPASECSPNDWDEGIQPGAQTMLPQGVITASNSWATTTGGKHYAVYFGATPNVLSTGEVVVQQFTMCGIPDDVQTYLIPETGYVTATSVDGSRVTLSASSGALFTFDLDSRQVSPLP